jgi:ABC-type polysaccharide/polyol phosphate transport system ATPase subunit
MIVANDAGVRFFFDRHRRVVTTAAARIRRGCTSEWGVRHATLAIGRGEGVALLGPSGSGKTTLLRLIAGVYAPDEGTLIANGRIATLLSTQAGLFSLLTGRENALHLGVLAGLSRAQARAGLEFVKQISDLDEYFERPVGSYSLGMRARLSLAVADQISPQILVLDEVHEALDHQFRNYLDGRAHDIVAKGGVVIAAGHDHPMLERLCTRAVHLDSGHIVADGPFDEVRRDYLASVQGGTGA